MRTVLTLIFCCILSLPADAKDPLIMMARDGSRVPPDQAYSYLIGAANSVVVTNNYLYSRGLPRLFCTPWEFALSPEKFFDAAEAKLVGLHKPEMIVIAAIDTLIEKYPCQMTKH